MTRLLAAVIGASLAAAFCGGVTSVSANALNKAAAAYQQNDYATSAKWLRVAAEDGDARAQFLLGNMYRTGKGVAKDHTQAVRLLERSAEQGFVPAQFGLGTMYAKGEGFTRSKLRALAWITLAATSDASAARARDALETVMSDSDVSRAREIARRCKASAFKNCDKLTTSASLQAGADAINRKAYAQAAKLFRFEAEKGNS